jgi:outer membrane protein assembly factor BamB
MSPLFRRHPPGSPSLWAALAFFLIFLALTALVYFRDPAYRDPERIEELKHVDLHAPEEERSYSVDWPQWRGPHRDGVSAETFWLKKWPADLLTQRKAWDKPLGPGFAALAVAGGRAFTMFQDGDKEAVICLDAATGTELWRFRYPARFVSGQGSGPRSTPTVDGACLYTVGATGLMHCLKTHPRDPAGEVVWKKDLLKDFGAENLPWGVSFSPLVDDKRAYVNPGGPDGRSIAALDKLTGQVLWQALDDGAAYSSPVAATLAGRPQVVFFTAAGAVGVSPATGTVYWRFPWKTSYDINAATPIVAGDYVFISSGYGRGCALLKIEAKADDACKASLVYRNRNMRCQFSSPVRLRDYIYGFDEGLLKCLDLRTGEVRWEQKGLDKGSLLIADNHLIALGEYGTLVLAEATPEEFREKGSVTWTAQRCWTVPVLADGRLYLRNEERVVCLDLRPK